MVLPICNNWWLLFNAINIVFVIDCSLLVFTFAGKQPLVLVGMLCQILGVMFAVIGQVMIRFLFFPVFFLPQAGV